MKIIHMIQPLLRCKASLAPTPPASMEVVRQVGLSSTYPSMEIGGRSLTQIFTPPRVAKCHIFYTEQIFQTKSYPIKIALITSNLAFKLNEIEIDG